MITLFNAEFSIWGVLLAPVVSTIVGMIWYGPAFGAQWMKLVGVKKEDAQMAPMDMAWSTGMALVTGLILSHIIYYVHFVTTNGINADGALSGEWNIWVSGIFSAVIVWAGFALVPMVHRMVWERSRKQLLAINAAHFLVSFIAIALVIVPFMDF